eukprot:m51a1_g10116 hypothetical protein (870) ;mRNA; r:28985-31594
MAQRALVALVAVNVATALAVFYSLYSGSGAHAAPPGPVISAEQRQQHKWALGQPWEELERRVAQSQRQGRRVALVVLGTRPEAVKLAPVIEELRARQRKRGGLECVAVSTGQHREMLAQTLGAFGLGGAVDVDLGLMRGNQTLQALTLAAVDALRAVVERLRPAVVVVQGDTTTSFAASLAAFLARVPVAHVEAGLRTRSLRQPFPEEFNRQAIGLVASLHFAATPWAARNLLAECKDPDTVLVTGNTVVDALRSVLGAAPRSAALADLLARARSRCAGAAADEAKGGSGSDCRVALLTAHRRESFGAPLVSVVGGVERLLRAFGDLAVVWPMHLNPNVRAAVVRALPAHVYRAAAAGERVEDPAYDHVNRLLLVGPLDYVDGVHLMNESHVVLTDSGGIQEEGVSLGRPVFVLRDNTERPEGVAAGSAELVGTSAERIFAAVSRVLADPAAYAAMARPASVYGDGRAAERIVDALAAAFAGGGGLSSLDGSLWTSPDRGQQLIHQCNKWLSADLESESDSGDSSDSDDSALGSQGDEPQPQPQPQPQQQQQQQQPAVAAGAGPDEASGVVVVLTVWKRFNVDWQLELVSRQSVLRTARVAVVVFQNGVHIDQGRMNATLAKWRASPQFRRHNVSVAHVHSAIETGYYGRFLAPFLARTWPGARWVVCDDDVIWGDRYFENLLRVVDEGSLAVRVGRYVHVRPGEGEWLGWSAGGVGTQVTFEEDVQYDFGGQVWAGRMDWLRLAWSTPPVSIMNGEDFWISAVLRPHGIATKAPRCPRPAGPGPLPFPDLCCCSDMSALKHSGPSVGDTKSYADRNMVLNMIQRAYHFRPMVEDDRNVTDKWRAKMTWWTRTKVFNVSGVWEKCAFFL